jgi:hypothetical protein
MKTALKKLLARPTMKRILAAAAALSSAVLAPQVLAVTTGTVSGTATVGYSCDMTLPGDITMTSLNATQFQGSDNWQYNQNADTTYELSALTVTAPTAATATGNISVRDVTNTTIVQNDSESASSGGNLTGIQANTGTIVVTMTETVDSSINPGTYTVSSKLTCSEAQL